jgi:hypothetical protein
VLLLLALPAIITGASSFLPAAVVAILAILIANRTIAAVLAARVLHRPFTLEFWFDVILMWVLQLVVLPAAASGAVLGLLGKTVAFQRTPKRQ